MKTISSCYIRKDPLCMDVVLLCGDDPVLIILLVVINFNFKGEFPSVPM